MLRSFSADPRRLWAPAWEDRGCQQLLKSLKNAEVDGENIWLMLVKVDVELVLMCFYGARNGQRLDISGITIALPLARDKAFAQLARDKFVQSIFSE